MLTGQILNGLVIGGMYALIAIGFTLVIGTLDRLNFAHPEAFMFGGFTAFLVMSYAPVWWALPVAFVLGGLIGILTEYISFRRFTSVDGKITAALSSMALGLVLTDLVQKKWGTEPVSLNLDSALTRAGFTIFEVQVLWIQVIILAVTLALMWGLHYVVTHTGVGRRIRAVAEAPVNASLLGINVKRVTQSVFFISSALAAVAGLLLAMRLGVANPDIGLTFGLKAIAIMAIGGIGDMRGAVIAGLAIGVLEALTFQFGLGRLGEMTVWLAMLIVLLFFKGGLFSSGLHEAEPRA